ncbi:hypothetical protein M8A51_03145 [Schlegelella sp. S2-27]|uniref:Response regulatory domain-containing protein n=1 Tax=Caldimonas mangrovi TaxID=2944811 RepID=A0ABT0YJD2_9BURK|nr:hypothetical protein [Caldimonas mangrovi]MCM5678524.1 hypothetical protein [Caldimonas mangrovi]
MDLSDLSSTEAGGVPTPLTGPAARADDDWRILVTQIGEEIAGPLTAALERVYALTSTGAIDRQGLRCLREELEQARRVGIASQQIVRFATGRVRQSHERLHLTQTLQSVLAHRNRETLAHGLEVRQVLRPVEVIVDPTLLFTLLNTLLDWALAHAQSNIELRLDMKPWPAHARLNCRFRHTPPDLDLPHGTEQAARGPVLNDMTWQLLRHTAAVMGLEVERADGDTLASLTLEFPRTVSDELPGLAALEHDDAFPSSVNSKPLAGSHVLVIASRRDVRVQVREAIRHMGLVVDFVNSVDEAVAFCAEGLPHAVIVESILRGERFNQLRADILRDAPEVAFIEIIEEGSMFEVSGFGSSAMGRVGRDAILASLPSALVFELSKGL